MITREQAIAELKRRGKYPTENIPPIQQSVSKEEAIAELKRRRQSEESSYWERAKQLGHGIKSGLLSLPVTAARNFAKGQTGSIVSAPERPELLESAENELKELSTPLKNDVTGRILHHAGEFGGASLIPIPGANALKAAKLAKQAGLGVGIGATSGALQETGINPLTADIIAGLSPVGGALIRHGGIGRRLAGLGPKKINVPLAEAAKRQGIDLPAAVLSDSAQLGLMNQVVSKTPLAGDVLNARYRESGNKIKNLLGDIKQSIGPEQDELWDVTKKALYDKELKSLPENSIIYPTDLVKKLKDMRGKMRSLSEHPDEKLIKNEIDSFLEKISSGEPVSVRDLIQTKSSFHKRYPDIDSGVKEYRKAIAHGIGEEIEKYGKNTPEAKQWFKQYQEAQEHYSMGARRKSFEKLLGDIGAKSENESINYKTLANRLNNRDNQKRLKQLILPKSKEGENIRKRLADLSILSEGMSNAKGRIPNPSGTATTEEAISFVKKLGTLAAVGTFAPISIPAQLATMGAMSYLVSSTKLVNSAIKFAKRPTNDLARRLNHIAKEQTGIGLLALNKELS